MMPTATIASAEILFKSAVIAVAGAEARANINRGDNPDRVTEYLALLGFPFAENGTPTPFCAAGLVWATCKAFCDLNGISYTDANRLNVLKGVLPEVDRLYFKPSASCPAILGDARVRRSFLDSTVPAQPGYLVFLNFDGDPTFPAHMGIVETLVGRTLHTIEFNTSGTSGQNHVDGGFVTRKARLSQFVVGYVRTYPDAETSP
jgi:hypothetical protein